MPRRRNYNPAPALQTSRMGGVPTWHGAGGPGCAVAKVVNRGADSGVPGGLVAWTLAGQHVEMVWGAAFALLVKHGQRPEPLEFGALLAQHFESCQVCQQRSRPYASVWRAAVQCLKLDDVLRVLWAESP